MKVKIEELELLLGPEDSEVDLMQILRYARRKRVAGSLKISARRVRVSSWEPAECDGMSVKGQWRHRRKRQEGVCQKLTTKSIKVGQQSTNRLQEECWTKNKKHSSSRRTRRPDRQRSVCTNFLHLHERRGCGEQWDKQVDSYIDEHRRSIVPAAPKKLSPSLRLQSCTL